MAYEPCALRGPGFWPAHTPCPSPTQFSLTRWRCDPLADDGLIRLGNLRLRYQLAALHKPAGVAGTFDGTMLPRGVHCEERLRVSFWKIGRIIANRSSRRLF
jgi:hypothetical protein